MFLKTYDGGDVEDLCLTFTVADEEFGANKEVSVFFLEEVVRDGARRLSRDIYMHFFGSRLLLLLTPLFLPRAVLNVPRGPRCFSQVSSLL